MTETELWNEVLQKLYPMSYSYVLMGRWQSIDIFVERGVIYQLYLHRPDWLPLVKIETTALVSMCKQFKGLKEVIEPYQVLLL